MYRSDFEAEENLENLAVARRIVNVFYFAPSALEILSAESTWGDAPGFYISRRWRFGIGHFTKHKIESQSPDLLNVEANFFQRISG